MNTMTVTECLICGAEFDAGSDVVLHELIECPECCTEFEVVGVNPLRLEIAPQEEEDWGE